MDKLGVAYEAPTVATGFGAYLAQVSLAPFLTSLFVYFINLRTDSTQIHYHFLINFRAESEIPKCIVTLHI